MKTILSAVSNVNPDKINRVFQAISKETYTQGEINEKVLTPKNIFSWIKGGYLLKARDEDKGSTWLKFTFLDYVWVKLLLGMSDLGVAKNPNSKRSSQQVGNVDKIVHCLAAGASSGLTIIGDYNPATEVAISDPIKRAAYNTLAAVIIDSVLTKAEYCIRIHTEGVCQLTREGQVVTSSDVNRLVASESFVQFALSDIFIDFVTRQIIGGKGKDLRWKSLLRSPEGNLVDYLRHGIVKSLMVEAVDGGVVNLPVAQDITEQTARLIANYMFSGQYKKMTYIIGGTTSSFSSTEDEIA